MTRHVDPARRCLRVSAWSETDRKAWETAKDPSRWGRVVRRSPATGLKAASIAKYEGGHGRYLGHLVYRGLFDPAEPPARRVTEARLIDSIDVMLANGNSGHTIYGRLLELVGALRILDPGGDHGWILRPGGVDLRDQHVDLDQCHAAGKLGPKASGPVPGGRAFEAEARISGGPRKDVKRKSMAVPEIRVGRGQAGEAEASMLCGWSWIYPWEICDTRLLNIGFPGCLDQKIGDERNTE
jgi:hypothetical protein